MEASTSVVGREASAAFRAHLRRQNRSLGTIIKYRQQVDHFVGWLGDRSPASLTRPDIERYLDDWFQAFEDEHGKAPAPSTVKLRIDALKCFYAFLDDREELVDEDGRLLRNPVEKIKPPKVKRKPNDWLRDDDDKRLLGQKLNEQERIIVYTLRWLGLRTGEAVALRISDVDLEAGRVYVRESKTEAGLREIPISNELAFEVRAWLRHLDGLGLNSPNNPLLVTKNGTPMAQQFVWRVVKRVALRAGLRVVERDGKVTSAVSPRTLRKTFGSHLLNASMPLKSVSKLLGHQNTTITEQVYAELLDTTVEAQFRSIVD
jgi:integrase